MPLMTHFPRAIRRLALVLPAVLLVPQPLLAQEPATPSPQHVTPAGGTPWIYEGSDVPRDEEWIFGELPNGLRYAVRKNGVPPDQVSVRVRIDAGSLHERDEEHARADEQHPGATLRGLGVRGAHAPSLGGPHPNSH